jgi:hypothetical protein
VFSSACTSFAITAITGIRFPPTEAGSIIARRNLTELVLPRARSACRLCPS